MKLEKYQEYKDSGEVWLGQIPKHWKVIRTKNVFRDINEKSETGDETLLTVSHITGVTPRSEKNVNMFMAETMEGYKKCKVGDLIVNTMWAWMGALGTSKYEGICSPAYNIYRPLKNVDWNYRYYDYLFRIPNAVMEMTRFSKGIVASRLRLYPAYFYQMNVVVPPIKEQDKIANYLGKEISLIDKKINLLTKKIKDYQDLKIALINRVVTKGLDDSVKMKDSEIEWIDTIPEHWKIKRIKDISNFQFSNVDKKRYEGQKDVLLCNYTDVYKNSFITSEISFMKSTASENEIRKFQIKDGDVLFTKDSETFNDIANPALVRIGAKKVICGYHLALMRPNSKFISGDFLFRLLQSSDYNMTFSMIAKGVTRVGLGLQLCKNLKIIVPPLSEQKSIGLYLNKKITTIDNSIIKLEEQISHQKDLIKSLINDVVTGKLKVSQD